MERMWIYIPTYQRANKQITFSKMPKEWQEQTIFVVRPEEASLFNWHCNPPLICAEIGVPAARQAALEHCPTNKMFTMDDGLTFSYRPKDWSMENTTLPMMDQEKLGLALRQMEALLNKFAIVGMDERGMNHGKPQRYFKNAGRIMRAWGVRKDIVMQENIRIDKYIYWEDFHTALSLYEQGYMAYLSVQFLNNKVTNSQGGVRSYRKFDELKEVREQFMKDHAPFVAPVDKQVKSWRSPWPYIPDVKCYWLRALRSARGKDEN